VQVVCEMDVSRAGRDVREWTTEELQALFERSSNAGRWGVDDELGTLNLITDDKRRRAAELIRTGHLISLAIDMSKIPSSKNQKPLLHLPLRQPTSDSVTDFFGLEPHGYAFTHLDAVAHCNWEGRVYNGRTLDEVWTSDGLSFGSIHAQRQGIFTRGVLLDVCGAAGQRFLEAGEYVTLAHLEAAEQLVPAGVESGDAIFVYTGLDVRETELGAEDITHRAGLHAECLDWIHDRDVAVYSGDCVERVPYPSAVMPLPLHQVGLGSIGLVLLDCPDLASLVEHCRGSARREFAFAAAPLRLPFGTGSPVNPMALF